MRRLRPSVSNLNIPLCHLERLSVSNIFLICFRTAERLSPGLLDRLSPGLLSRSSISKLPVNLHLQYFFIPMCLFWRFCLFKSVLWNWLKVLWYRFMRLLLLDKCFFAITFVKFFKNVHCICVTCKPKACVIKSTSCRNVESFFVTSNLHTC